MSTKSFDQFDLLAPEPPLSNWRLWAAWFCFIGGLFGSGYCVYMGWITPTTPKTVTKQITIVEEVRRTTRMDQVKVGDTVLARDEIGNSIGPKKVTKVFRRSSDHLRLLTFEARDGTRQTIKTTDEHPFGLADSLDFLHAAQLEVGQVVPGPKGELQTLVASIREEHPEGIPVFNFEVEGAHTYFVSAGDLAAPVLVHNICEFSVGRHGDMPSPRMGNESHHGVMSAWMSRRFPHYDPDLAPAVLMSVENHKATRGVYNTWRAEIRRRMGGVFDWDNVTDSEIRGLSERMFDAANVPQNIRDEYWDAFARMRIALSTE